MVKNPPANRGDPSSIPGCEDPWRRAWQPTPVSLPGESHGRGLQSMGSHRDGHDLVIRESEREQRNEKENFFFWLLHSAYGILVSRSGINLCPLHWKHRVSESLDHQGSPLDVNLNVQNKTQGNSVCFISS